jgi:hypothetical protein
MLHSAVFVRHCDTQSVAPLSALCFHGIVRIPFLSLFICCINIFMFVMFCSMHVPQSILADV